MNRIAMASPDNYQLTSIMGRCSVYFRDNVSVNRI